LEVVQLLLAAKADVHKTNEYGGVRATHCAPSALHFQTCTQLQRLFPPITTHFFCRNGFTPLHEAARHGDLRVVQLLVGEGADVNAVALE
jgi:ankyrin repeat protein